MRAVRLRGGFVLPAVLLVVAVVTLVFLTVILSLDSLAAEARAARDDVTFRQASLSVEADLAWLMASEPLSENAIAIGRTRSEATSVFDPQEPDNSPVGRQLILDGRAYQLPAAPPSEGLIATIQDQGGLVNLNMLTEPQKRRLFEQLGVSGSEAARMAARFTDYIDTDDFTTPNGAEMEAYAREGAGRPQNGPLVRVDEMAGVLGFNDAVRSNRYRDLRGSLTADPTSFGTNVNTMTAEVMTVLFGIDAARAEGVVAQRRSGPFLSFEDFAAAAGLVDQAVGEASATFPTGRVTLKVLDRRRGIAYRSRIATTPSDRDRPVWIEDRSFTPLSAEERRVDHSNVEPFPISAP